MREKWAVKPETLSPDQAEMIYEADIVVIGAGHAGTCAARAAAEAGARVIVLEQQGVENVDDHIEALLRNQCVELCERVYAART